jgi:hypothetical protein
MYTKLCSGKPEGQKSLGRLRCTWDNTIKMILKKYGVKMLAGFIWLRLGSSGRLF